MGWVGVALSRSTYVFAQPEKLFQQNYLLENKIICWNNFSSKNITVYAIFNDQSFNDTLTNDIVSFEQLGPG